MKKKIKYLSIILLILIACCFGTGKTIITSSKQVFEENNDKEVTLRDLALLMSLVYEDIPNEANYSSSSSDYSEDCYNNNIFTGDCKYIYYEGQRFNRNGYLVEKYVEGLSARKANLFTAITTARTEDGQSYYFLTYAKTFEASEWKIVNFKSAKTLGSSQSGIMDAVTFKRGNNYVISYRGTDFPDVLEWLQDILYIKGEHAQADAAYEYAQSEYDRIVAENPNANIYIVGHSLGGYLAQVGGIAIVERERQLGVSNNSKLAQVAYFNGMGISGLGVDNGSIDKWIEDLKYLASHDRNGNEVTSTERITNYETPSSGRLILYQIGGENASQGDPVSELGIHFGEIIRLEAAKDSVNYHIGNHQLFINGSWEDWFSTIPQSVENFISESIEKIKNSSLETIIEDVKSLFNKEEAKMKLTEAISNTISIIANSSELTTETISEIFTNRDLPEPLKSRASTAIKTLGGLFKLSLDLNGDDVAGTKVSFAEKLNIYHETDSFLCLNDYINADNTINNNIGVVDENIDGNNGIPTVTVVLSDHYDNSNGMGIKQENNTTKLNTPNAISTITVKGINAFRLGIQAEEGCARKYEVYETTKGNRVPVTVNDVYFDVSEYNENNTRYDAKIGLPVRTFEIRVYYGNKLQPMVLKDNKYVSYGETQGDYEKYVKHQVKVIYEEGPTCKIIDPANGNKNVTLTKTERKIFGIKITNIQKSTVNVVYECTAKGGISDKLAANIATSYDNNGNLSNYIEANPFETKVKRISENKIKVTLPVEVKKASKVPILLTTTLKPVDKFGNIGKSSLTVGFNITVK